MLAAGGGVRIAFVSSKALVIFCHYVALLIAQANGASLPGCTQNDSQCCNQHQRSWQQTFVEPIRRRLIMQPESQCERDPDARADARHDEQHQAPLR